MVKRTYYSRHQSIHHGAITKWSLNQKRNRITKKLKKEIHKTYNEDLLDSETKDFINNKKGKAKLNFVEKRLLKLKEKEILNSNKSNKIIRLRKNFKKIKKSKSNEIRKEMKIVNNRQNNVHSESYQIQSNFSFSMMHENNNIPKSSVSNDIATNIKNINNNEKKK